jgi:hypothetical protein
MQGRGPSPLSAVIVHHLSGFVPARARKRGEPADNSGTGSGRSAGERTFLIGPVAGGLHAAAGGLKRRPAASSSIAVAAGAAWGRSGAIRGDGIDLCCWGLDRARYVGVRKNLFDLRRAAAIQNLEAVQRQLKVAA